MSTLYHRQSQVTCAYHAVTWCHTVSCTTLHHHTYIYRLVWASTALLSTPRLALHSQIKLDTITIYYGSILHALAARRPPNTSITARTHTYVHRKRSIELEAEGHCLAWQYGP